MLLWHKEFSLTMVLPKLVQAPNMTSPYIVEKFDEMPTLEVKNAQVKQLFLDFETTTIKCRINNFLPRSEDLHQWTYSNWT